MSTKFKITRESHYSFSGALLQRTFDYFLFPEPNTILEASPLKDFKVLRTAVKVSPCCF